MSEHNLEKNQRWYIKSRKCFSNDLKKFNEILFDVSRAKSIKIGLLGKVNERGIFLLSPQKRDKNKDSILIIGGIHGDEPGGCWGILSFLENASQKLLNSLNLYIIPVFNPTGFRLGNIDNVFNESTNEGYYLDKNRLNLSHEGKIITKANLERLNILGLLTLHEDYDQNRCYIYAWEKSIKPGVFTKHMANACRGIFKRYNGMADSFRVNKGIVFNLQNYEVYKEEDIDSLEFYFFKKGVREVSAAEVPRIQDMDKRIDACRKIVEKFVGFYI